MHYYSTSNRSLQANFKEATLAGQALDGGLFFPSEIPQLPKGFIDAIENLSYEEIALEIIKPYVKDAINNNSLQTIVADTIPFTFPLVELNETISTLELFHGPTQAFKDVGARFMSRCLGYFTRNNNKKITVLVATSGDTGAAVAHGFYGVEGVEVVILYPASKISKVQELQLTTLGKNITALKVDGSFDDCQQLVKAAFRDKELNDAFFLTSANSINVARWLPQQFYYFFAYQQWKNKAVPPVVSVPSGNFGNICAGLLAYKSGLPVQHFIAASNANRSVTNYLTTGVYEARPTVPTLSNAMDVGDPSNFIRMLELFEHHFGVLKSIVSSESISDATTRKVIKEVFAAENYLLDPHGAIGYAALKNYLKSCPGRKGYFLETAHPAKFFDSIRAFVDAPIPLPDEIKTLLDKKGQSISIPFSQKDFKAFLLRR